MRPNDSATHPVNFGKSPLRAFLLNGLLLGLLIVSADAQTRLNSTQVAPVQGDAQGQFGNMKLRDYNSAADHGNGITNAIASAIADCGTTISCSIIVPPSYGVSEAVPGYHLNYSNTPSGAMMSGNISIFDRRYSDARMSANNIGYNVGFINAPSGWLYNYYSKAANNGYLASLYIKQWSLDGGNNQQNSALNYADKTTWATFLANSISYTPGQHVSVTMGAQMLSLGDYTGIKNNVGCYGGYTAQGDLGCHAADNKVAHGAVEYSGTLTGSPAAGATSVTVVPTQGSNTQGAGRFLARMSSGTISSGTISQITTNPGNVTVTGTGTGWPVATAIAQLGTNVSTPGTATVSPTSFSTGAMSAIQTSSLVCVADQQSFEMVYPTAVTATTFTANFANVHPNNSTISTGGLCGYLLDLTADEVTSATFPAASQTITGTLHFAWPIMASSSATSATVWVSGGGGWQQLVSRWNASTANGYVLYPFAAVTSVQQSGTISNTLTLSPNNVAWIAGDTVSEFLYPASHLLYGNTVIESYYPSIVPANAWSLIYNQPLQGTDTMLTIANNTPNTLYNSHGGVYSSPRGLHLESPTSQTFTADLPADNATIGIGCVAPCSGTENIIAAQNPYYYDFLYYDASNRRWALSTNVNNTRYSLGATQMQVPISNVSMASDGRSVGYIQAQQARSSSTSNSDSSGELAFSNALSVTQTLQGTYTSHPECMARPQFDAGSSNRYWISYSGTASFSVNFATPVTGNVSYSCAARN